MKKYRSKKRQTISAIQWTGENTDDVIKFGTFKIGDKTYHDIDYPPYDNKTPELWVSSFNGGDNIYIGDYAASINNEIAKLTQQEIEDNWVFLKEDDFYQIYKEKNPPVYEAVQWTGDNTEECLEFLNHNGSLDKSGKQILIMNYFGGAVCEQGDYILKYDDAYSAVLQVLFERRFEEI